MKGGEQNPPVKAKREADDEITQKIPFETMRQLMEGRRLDRR